MVGRDFLDVADQLAQESTEAHWRTAVGRCYYALFLEGREALLRWGFTPPPRGRAHSFVRLHFLSATDGDLKAFGRCLERLGNLRNRADYQLGSGMAINSAAARNAVADARAALALLDGVEADAPRLATAIAGIRAAFP